MILVVLCFLVFIVMNMFNLECELLIPDQVLELGPGWAGNTVNTAIFRHHGVVTQDNYQYTSFFDPDGSVVLVRRSLKDNSIITYRLQDKSNPEDAHNSISMGLDSESYIHISYDQHGGKLNYRRSIKPYDITKWTEKIPMTGTLEEKVTYPTFIMRPMNSDDNGDRGELFFLYRYGSSGNGDAILKTYDVDTKKWEDRAVGFLKGTEQKPWTSNAYWNHPAFDKDGNLEISFVWRVNRGGPPDLVNNVNIGYIQTPDGGKTWKTSLGKTVSSPITQVNGEVIRAISPGSNLINQSSSATDSKGNLHIVYYSNDLNGIPQYQHLWFDGQQWQHAYISERIAPFELYGKGTLQIPISRPEIIIDDKDSVYVIYRGDLTNNRMVVQRLKSPDYEPQNDIRVLWDESLLFAEPIIDRKRWERDGILTMLIQENFQPNHEATPAHVSKTVYLVDWNITQGW